jgi:hypothetical protein
MLSQASGQAAIQIVRVDGQHLQTLYCAPAGDSFAGAQLSPNQHVLAFTQVNQDESQSILSVLDLTTGQVRTVLSPQASGYPQSTDVQATSTWAPLLAHVSSLASDTPLNPLPSQHALTFTPLTWINNTSLYLSGGIRGASPVLPSKLYILRNINSSVTQQQGNVQLVAAMATIANCSNFAVTPDNQNVICSIFQQMGWTDPGLIQLQPIAGGTTRTIYRGPAGSTMTTRAASSSALIFILSQANQADTLWKINTDGSGLTQLASTGSTNSSFQFANASDLPWSMLSPDSTFYAIGENDRSNGTQTLFINRFSQGSNGASRGITLPGNELELVGWAF